MKHLSVFVLAILFFTLPAFAQQKWTRIYGGDSLDSGSSVEQTSDGGYIITGYTESFGAGPSDVWLIKTNSSGDTLWTRMYGGTGVDIGNSVRQTSDGGYIIAGSTSSFGVSYYDVYLIKTNASGDTLWTRTFGGTNDDEGFSVQQTSDGGYIIAGETSSFGAGGYDVWLIKTNASGDTLWTKTYGGPSYEWGNSIQQTLDGGYIVTGYTLSFGAGNGDVWLIKTNASGDTLWTKTYGETGTDLGNSVRQTQDGGYIIAGKTSSFGNGDQVYLIKADSSGDTLWSKTYGGALEDVGYSVQQTTDGGYIIAGKTFSFGAGYDDVYLIKTNTYGDTLWTRTYGGTISDGAQSVQQTADGGYIIGGYAWSFGHSGQVYLIKTDGNGNVGIEEQSEVRCKKLEGRITTQPNPFTSFATIPGHEGERFALYEITGRRVGTYSGNRIGEGLSPGVYFLRSSNNKDKSLRIVKVK